MERPGRLGFHPTEETGYLAAGAAEGIIVELRIASRRRNPGMGDQGLIGELQAERDEGSSTRVTCHLESKV
jgi:hypothetical protein